MLSKKHFEAIANIIKAAEDEAHEKIERDDLIVALADYFETQNPQFSRCRFYQACGEYNK